MLGCNRPLRGGTRARDGDCPDWVDAQEAETVWITPTRLGAFERSAPLLRSNDRVSYTYDSSLAKQTCRKASSSGSI